MCGSAEGCEPTERPSERCHHPVNLRASARLVAQRLRDGSDHTLRQQRDAVRCPERHREQRPGSPRDHRAGAPRVGERAPREATVPAGLRAPGASVLAHPVTRPTRARRVTADRLPLDDRSVDALADDVRTAAARHWERRAKSELRIGRGFAVLAERLAESGAHPRVVELTILASEDEPRHAEICRQLSGVYAGSAPPDLELEDLVVPNFGTGDERLELVLLVAGTCCINETIATSWIEASLRSSRAPIAVAAHRAHLREEIDHARIGWAHLASSAVSDDLRDAMGERLVAMLDANVAIWTRPDAFLPPEGVTDHGLLSRTAAHEAVRSALADLVLPGFERVGVGVARARTWLASSSPSATSPE